MTEQELETVTTAEEAQEAGYFGVKQDPEPNETYTFEGAADALAEVNTTNKAAAKPAAAPAKSAKSEG